MTTPSRALARRLGLGPVYWRWKRIEGDSAWRNYRRQGTSQIARYVEARRRNNQDIRLQIGAGGKSLPDWLNTDYDRHPNCAFLDATQPWPFADGELSLILAEHVIANLPKDGAKVFLAESYRCLQPGDILRLSTPNLTALSRLLISDDMEDVKSRLLQRHQRLYRRGEEISFCDLVNDIHYLWGHRYLYTEDELIRQLRLAGFSQIERASFGQSRDPRLMGVDQHQAGPEMAAIDLIVEARR